jgi:hypothetical protein
MIGDWLVAGAQALRLSDRKLWNEAKAVSGYQRATLKNFKWIAETFPKSRRRDGVSWSHHREVAPLPEAGQDELLDKWGKRPLKDLKPAVKNWISTVRENDRREAYKRGELPLRSEYLAAATTPPGREKALPISKKDFHIKIEFGIYDTEVLLYLFETEKQVHGQKTPKDMLMWLLYNSLTKSGWFKKGQDFLKLKDPTRPSSARLFGPADGSEDDHGPPY